MRWSYFAASVVAAASVAVAQRSGIDENKIWFTDERGNTVTIFRNLVEIQEGKRVHAWVEKEFRTPIQSTVGQVKSIKSLDEYDCGDRTGRTLYITSYDPTGASHGGSKVDRPIDQIIPGTTGELEFVAICKLAGFNVKNSFKPQ